jgi:predicted nuclease of restriction endonuclease-like (RecB) superfamily
MRIDNKDERDFYEMQAMKEGWGKRELKRQYGSSIIMVLPVKQMKQILRRMCWF